MLVELEPQITDWNWNGSGFVRFRQTNIKVANSCTTWVNVWLFIYTARLCKILYHSRCIYTKNASINHEPSTSTLRLFGINVDIVWVTMLFCSKLTKNVVLFSSRVIEMCKCGSSSSPLLPLSWLDTEVRCTKTSSMLSARSLPSSSDCASTDKKNCFKTLFSQ